MANYSHCPNCCNSEKGTSIHKCTNCGFIGCFKGGGLMSSPSGCYSSSRCPRCDKQNTSKQIDKIT